jgi:dienelactone hydrolase
MPTVLIPYTEADDRFDVALARPASAGPHPVVLVCHAWAGRGPHELARAERLAELGYIGAAIDLYGVGQRGTDRASSAALMRGLVADPAKLRRRLAAALAAVVAVDGVDRERLGAIGFCFGGTCAILAARMGLPLRGVVSFHGLLKIGEPLDAQVQARILVLHGQDDPMVAPADIASFAAEMQRIHADWQLHAYPGAVHAFTNPSAQDPEFGTVYDPDADRRSWAEMTAFFADVLA